MRRSKTYFTQTNWGWGVAALLLALQRGQESSRSQPSEHEVLAQLEGDLVPEVHDHCALELLHALEDQARHDSEMSALEIKMRKTYDLPVLSCSGLICSRLKYEKYSSTGAAS